MAVPSYTTDLVTFNDATSANGWGEATGMTASAGPGTDTDLAIQGSVCITQDRHATGLSSQVYSGSQPAGWTAGDCFFIWTKFFAPNSLDTFANGGQRVLIGSSSSNYYGFYVDGSDTYAYGGWKNYAVDPSISAVRDQTQGSPTGTWNTVGNGWNSVNQVKKGNPMNTDVITSGRGELIITGGQAANYAVFSGIATVNDATTARWGLFQDTGGSYLWKGLMSFGTSGTLVDFRDSNVAIVVDDTFKVGASFNRVEVNNASSNVEWISISITKVGTVSKGEFEMVDNATVTHTGCTFTDMSTFIYQSNATVTGTTFRRCGQVTAGGADFDGCLFTNTTASTALLAGASVSTISNCDFQSDGSSHAIEITSGTSHTLDGLTFTGYEAYSAGGTSTGNEALYVNIPSGDVTIYADSNISYRTAGANVTIVAGAVSFSVDTIDIGGSAIDGAQVALFAKDGTGALPYQDAVTVSSNGTTATVAHTAHGMQTGDKALIAGLSNTGLNGVQTITVTGVDSYTYTTTITQTSISGTSTWCALYGATVSGTLSDSRTFSTDQPVSGWARKSTSSPYYKTAPVSGTINTTSGMTLTALLLSDE